MFFELSNCFSNQSDSKHENACIFVSINQEKEQNVVLFTQMYVSIGFQRQS